MELELDTPHTQKPSNIDDGDDHHHHRYHPNVDTSRPFRSVKEAVAIFGQRILVLHHHHDDHAHQHPIAPSPQPQPLPLEAPTTPTTSSTASGAKDGHDGEEEAMEDDTPTRRRLERLESELDDTKLELKLLKEKENETQVALASLNAQLHLNMSKLAQSEAAAAAKDYHHQQDIINIRRNNDYYLVRSSSMHNNISNNNTINPTTSSATLAQILSLDGDYFGSNKKSDYSKFTRTEKNTKKIKPIIPLVSDLFSFKKGSSATDHLHNPRRLYASSQFYH
ncbi:hypothetical protein FNV43_RR03059 [Rhamnella rubrinervis]|uniref:Uncharacterized protein n=1 Tax=Rhamnella rubrinervis TaxID=2594499 RepID=A0A8K0HH21_9ROSA|nr:hypothetical protein FNV43_RR03059 [Rhamnella rubrinervis]